MNHRASTVKNVTNYIGHKVAGANKMQSAKMAGYSDAVARRPMQIENTQTYKDIADKILSGNARIMLHLIESLQDDILNGALDSLKPTEKSQILKVQAQVEDIMKPKVTLKQVTDKNGNVTRTAWAQNASQVQEVLSDEGEYEGE